MHKAAIEADNIKIEGGEGELSKGVQHMRESSFGGAAPISDFA